MIQAPDYSFTDPRCIRTTKLEPWVSLQWRHNECNGISNHQPHDCLLNSLFRHRSKKSSKLRITVLCDGNWSVKPLQNRPEMRKMFPSDDVIMYGKGQQSGKHSSGTSPVFWVSESASKGCSITETITSVIGSDTLIYQPVQAGLQWIKYARLAAPDTRCMYAFSPHKEVSSHQCINKQRVLMHRHQGWNVRHGLCHIYMRYIYIYELFIAFVCFVVCSLL